MNLASSCYDVLLFLVLVSLVSYYEMHAGFFFVKNISKYVHTRSNVLSISRKRVYDFFIVRIEFVYAIHSISVPIYFE